jgi:RNA polymerase sigma-70 factor (ECF subfamily)
VVQEAYLALRGKFPHYRADPRLPFFLWLRLEVGQKLVDLHRFHLEAKLRDAGQVRAGPEAAQRRVPGNPGLNEAIWG